MGIAADVADAMRSEVVLFLGAGASKPVGLPVMNEFFERALKDSNFADSIEKPLNYQADARRMDVIERNKNALLYSLVRAAYVDTDTRVYDLEQVLAFTTKLEHLLRDRGGLETSVMGLFLFQSLTRGGLIDMAHFRKEYSHEKKRLQAFIKDVRKAIGSLRNRIHDVFGGGYDQKKAEYAASIYVPLFGVIGRVGGSIPVFTTNYDSVLEGQVHNELLASWHLARGSLPHRTTYFWDLVNYIQELGKERTVFYVKLHGSLTWKRDPDGRIEDRGPNESVPNRPVILYPVESSKTLDEEPFVSLYEVFRKVLQTARVCVVIGFSFRDGELREIFRQAIARPEGAKLIAICPTAPKGQEYADEHLLKLIKDYGSERVIRIPAKFGEPETLEQLDETLQSVL